MTQAGAHPRSQTTSGFYPNSYRATILHTQNDIDQTAFSDDLPTRPALLGKAFRSGYRQADAPTCKHLVSWEIREDDTQITAFENAADFDALLNASLPAPNPFAEIPL